MLRACLLACRMQEKSVTVLGSVSLSKDGHTELFKPTMHFGEEMREK